MELPFLPHSMLRQGPVRTARHTCTHAARTQGVYSVCARVRGQHARAMPLKITLPRAGILSAKPRRPIVSMCPLQAMSAVQKKSLLLPGQAGQVHFKKAGEALLGTCVDGSQAGRQGRQGTTKAQESSKCCARCKAGKPPFETNMMLVSMFLMRHP